MGINTTRVSVTTAGAKLLFGSGSTIMDTNDATIGDPFYVNIENISAGRVWLSGSSAGTTANSWPFAAFGTIQGVSVRAENVFCFTSNGVTAALCVMGRSR